MSRSLHLALIAALALLPSAAAATPSLDPGIVFQLQARESLRSLRPGDRLTVAVLVASPKGTGDAARTAARSSLDAARTAARASLDAARTAARSWSLVIAPCASFTTDPAPQRASDDGLFRLTVPRAAAPDAPYICVARWHDDRPSDEPIPLRFCLGDLTFRDCHPEWYATQCTGVSEAECLRRATIDGKRNGGEPSGSLHVIADGRRSFVPDTVRAGCPVHAPGWGVVYTRDGQLMRLDLARREAGTVREPPPGVQWSSPWPDGDALLLVATHDGHRALVRLDPAGAITPLRTLPAGVGRILGRAGDALLMSHRLSPHAVRVPLDATRPAVQLDVGAPLGDCAVEVDGVRVENDGIERTTR